MQVTVRTLDSVSMTFDIDDEVAQDISVIGFKEFIECDVGVPANRQRIIFKGKVLQDDNSLMSYGVFGNVVHLVQRPPPSADQRRNPVTTTSSNTSTHTDTNPSGSPNVYIGGIYSSGDVNQLTQQLVENILSSFGAGAQANVTTSASADGSSVDVQIAVQSQLNDPSSSQHSTPDETKDRLKQANRFLKDANKVLEEGGVQNTNDETNAEQPVTETNQEDSSEFNNTPEALAAVLDRLLEFNRTFQPMVERYQCILRSPGRTPLPDDDHIPDDVAEIFHNLSHSLHALSDLSFNMHSQQPRRLTCFPRLSPLDIPLPQPFNPPLVTARATSQSNSSTQSSQGHPTPVITAWSLSQSSSSSTESVTSTTTAANSTTSSNSSAGTTPRVASSQAGVWPFGGQGMMHRTPIGIVTVVSTDIQIPVVSLRSNLTASSAVQSTSTSTPTTAGISNTSSGDASRSTPSSFTTTTPLMTNIPRPNVLGSSAGDFFSSLNQTGRQRFLFPGMFQSATQQPSSRPSVSTTSASSSTSPRVSLDGSSFTTARTPSFPFPNIPIPGLSLPSHHPDPLLPCQSFHFGPSFQQQRPSATTSFSMTGNRGGSTATSTASTSSRQTVPTTVDTQSQQPSEQAPSSATPLFSNEEQQMFASIIQNAMGTLLGSANAAQGRTQQSTPMPASANESGETDSQSQELQDTYDAVIGQLLTGGFNQNLRDVINSLVGRVEQDEDDLLYRFMDSVIGYLSVVDVVQMAAGITVEPINRLRPQLREFVETHFNGRRQLTEADIPAVVQRIVDKFEPYTKDIVSKLELKEDNIDLEATLRVLDTKFFIEGLQLLIGDPENFGGNMVTLYRKYCGTVFGVCDHCVVGGMDELCRVSMNLQTIRTILGNTADTATNYVLPRLRRYATENPLSSEELEQLLVLKSAQGTLRDGETSDTLMQVDLPCATSSKPKSTDVNQIWADMNGVDSSGECSDGEGDTSCKTAEWNRHVPKEWVPIMTRDIKRQRVAAARLPHSDAYLNGMPPKRRKAVKRYTSDDVDPMSMLQDSVEEAKVTPETTPNEIVKDCLRSNMQKSFQEQVRQDLRQRLNRDPEYRPRRHPNTDKYFKPEDD